MKYKRMNRSGRSMLIAALPEERGAAGPLRQDDAAMPPKWHDDSGLNLRGEQFEPYGFTGWKWE